MPVSRSPARGELGEASRLQRFDPVSNCRFRLEIDGNDMARFSEVIIGAATTDVIDYREGSDPMRVRKLPGLTKYGNVTLKRGIIRWWNAARQPRAKPGRRPSKGLALPRDVRIVLLDGRGADALRWLFRGATPVAYHLSRLNALGNDTLIESLELSVASFELHK